MKRYLGLILLILLAGTAFADPMPGFKLPNELGKTISLESILGDGPVIIDFWADYCQPCKQGMAKLEELQKKYDSLTVVVVSLDAPKMQQKAKNYIKNKGYKFITLYDADRVLAKKLNIENPPFTLILDKTGEIIFQHLGYEPGMEKEYELVIRKIWGLPEAETEAPKTPDTGTTEGTACHD